jgi:hypothetical protein
MGVEVFQLWHLVIAAAALTGWWLTLRPRASYAGISTPMSYMIVLLAVLLCVLAVSGQRGRPWAPPPQQIARAP